MTKTRLITEAEDYIPYDAAEQAHKTALLDLLRGTDACFMRSDFPGHVTGSAWVLSKDGTKTLMTHHKAIGRWLQFGGHVDGDPDIKAGALREAREESGIEEFQFLLPGIFDIDIQLIPANPKRGEPEHLHYDIRYLLAATSKEFTVSDESNDLRWFTLAELREMNFDPGMWRMIEKWRRIV